MSIHWDSLLVVFAVSLSSTVAVVALVGLAMLGLSARAAAPRGSTGDPPFPPPTGTAVAGVCLAVAAAIVLFGLWTIVAR